MSQGDLGASLRGLGVLTRGVTGLDTGVKPPSTVSSFSSVVGEVTYRVRLAESVSTISLTGVTLSKISFRRGPSTLTQSGFKSLCELLTGIGKSFQARFCKSWSDYNE